MLSRIALLAIVVMLTVASGCAENAIADKPAIDKPAADKPAAAQPDPDTSSAARPFEGQPGGDDPNTLPIATVAATDGQAVALAGKSEEPEIVVVRHQKGHNYFIADLVLVNPLNVPVRYRGYRMDSWTERPAVGEISPWFGLKTQNKADDPWQNAHPGFCGNGSDIMVVRPKEAGRFHVEIPLTSFAAKVSVVCTWNQLCQETKQEISSPIISLAEP